MTQHRNFHHNLVGQRFGRLVVIKLKSIDHRYQVRWRCRCDCGNDHVVSATHLKRGLISSCGCKRSENTRERGKANKRHGHTIGNRMTPEYRSWRAMRDRCLRPNHHAADRYSGSGIKICKRWSKFENFLADMGKRPKGKSLDRFPNPYGDYKPSNCRWATPKEQRQNHRKPRIIT